MFTTITSTQAILASHWVYHSSWPTGLPTHSSLLQTTLKVLTRAHKHYKIWPLLTSLTTSPPPWSPSLSALSSDPWRHRARSHLKALTLAVPTSLNVLSWGFGLLTQGTVWKVISPRWSLATFRTTTSSDHIILSYIFTTCHYLKASSLWICLLTCSLSGPLEYRLCEGKDIVYLVHSVFGILPRTQQELNICVKWMNEWTNDHSTLLTYMLLITWPPLPA